MILTTLLATASLLGGPTTPPVSANTSEATAEGIEILRRILADSLDQTFAKKKKEGEEAPESGEFHALRRYKGLINNGLSVATLWSDSQTVQHSRAFHLPDVGLFLALDAALPVVSKEKGVAEPGKEEPKAKDDEWEAMRRQVRTNGSSVDVFLRPRVLNADREIEIDPHAIDQAIETVLKTIARHATRIEGLAPQETITIALRLSGRSQTEWSFNDGPVDEEGADDQTQMKTLSYVLAATNEAREQNLVIRVALADLANYGDSGYERLRQRAQINRY